MVSTKIGKPLPFTTLCERIVATLPERSIGCPYHGPPEAMLQGDFRQRISAAPYPHITAATL